MYDKYLNKLESLLDTKLEKTEKVELSLVDDIDKDYKELVGVMSEAEKLTKQRSRLKGRGRTLSKKIIDNYTKAQAQFKELGIDEGQYLGTQRAFAKNALQTIEDNFPF